MNHNRRFLLAFGTLLIIAAGCKSPSTGKSPYLLIDWFEYQGKDAVFDTFKPGPDQYQNPVLSGFYPDPSICRVDSDYYLVNSSFSYFPGIPIFHSRDLVIWKQIGHVLDRPSQLKLDSLPLSGGVFAPAIQYHKGIFYVINTIVYGGGNFYVTATNPAGPWSDPVWFPEIDGIDPSFFFDEDGKAYVVNNGPPEGKELYQGHRAIWMQEFLADSGKLTGPRKVIVNAGVDITKKPIWIEGPHVFKKQGYYYLIAAEGGTSTGHSEVVFRAKSVWGPYIPAQKNPMITQRHLDEGRANPVTSTGHADFVETQNGEWWAVFLGCRPYSGDLYNTGRETFMMPVSWNNGWPFISDSAVPYVAKRPGLPENLDSTLPTSGNFMWRDDFNDTTLAMNWNFLRTPGKAWYSLNTQPGYLRIDLQPVSIQELAHPSFIGRRQQHGSFSVSAAIQPFSFDTASTGGLVAFQNEKNYLFLGLKKAGKDFIAFLERSGSDSGDGHPQLLASVILTREPGTVYLKIDGKGGKYDFSYSLDKENWIVLKSDVDAKNLSTNVAGGFVGTYLGLYGSIKHSGP